MLDPESVVRQLWDASNDRDYARLAGAIAEGLVDGLRTLHEAFPDGHREIVDLHLTGDDVVVEWRMAGTNTGPLNGEPATGRPFARRGCSVATVRGGKIVAYHDYFDRLTQIEQLGPDR